MAEGKVKWFDSKLGYGFIKNEELGDVFVHHTAIEGDGFKTLRRGEEVQYEIIKHEKGPQATKVIRK